MKFKSVLIGSILLVVSQFALAEGWQGIPFGATEQQVLELGAKIGVTPRPKVEKYRGQYTPLWIRNYQVGGEPHEVAFKFGEQSRKLELVGVFYRGNTALYQYNQLEKALTEKYGKPAHRSADENSREATWRDPSARIELKYLDVLGSDGVSVIYTPPESGISDKL